MKIDAFHYIQLGTVYRWESIFNLLLCALADVVNTLLSCLACRGLHPVSDEEVIAMYEGSHVPLEIMSDFYGKVTTSPSPSSSPL